jgi:hypothetical protein
MQFAVYGAFLLLVRALFYLSPESKHLFFYALKAAVEISGFFLLYRFGFPIALAVPGLLVLLNLFTFVIETKISSKQRLEPAIGLLVYAAAFALIFAAGHIEGFRRFVTEWASRQRFLDRKVFYICALGGFLIVFETEHLFRFLRAKFAGDADGDRIPNGIYQAAGYSERAAVVALTLLSQFIAIAILAAGRLISANKHAGITSLSLAWALIWGLLLRYAITL